MALAAATLVVDDLLGAPERAPEGVLAAAGPAEVGALDVVGQERERRPVERPAGRSEAGFRHRDAHRAAPTEPAADGHVGVRDEQEVANLGQEPAHEHRDELEPAVGHQRLDTGRLHGLVEIERTEVHAGSPCQRLQMGVAVTGNGDVDDAAAVLDGVRRCVGPTTRRIDSDGGTRHDACGSQSVVLGHLGRPRCDSAVTARSVGTARRRA